MKKVWLSVNEITRKVDVPPIGKDWNYAISTGRYGELYLTWEYLYGGANWQDYADIGVRKEQCRPDRVLLFDMGALTLLILNSTYYDVIKNKPRLGAVLVRVEYIVDDIVASYFSTWAIEKSLKEKFLKTAKDVIRQWTERVLDKCSNEFLDKYGI